MAAGQDKKRLTSSSLHEHYRGKKKKKPNSSDYMLNLRSEIYLEWSDSYKKAVAKREQIGITWTDMTPFFDFLPQHSSGLADAFCVPPEIYSLGNLKEVLSHEVWATCLSESERKLLLQFLPSGSGAEHVVQSLLSGENHHFGNSFLKWSTSLCSGLCHPDDVLQRERQIRSNKKQYYSELNKYHTNMLEGLKSWKDRWLCCNDPEKLWSKASIKHKERKDPIPLERFKETPQKVYIRNGDIAKYMSYIKISKKQHEALKNLKHSGDGIQSKSLSRVLGDMNAFCVHPYETLEGEENNRLHKHWLQVINGDLPMAFEIREKKKLQREQLKQILDREFSEKRALMLIKKGTTLPDVSSLEKIEDRESDAAKVHVQEDVVPKEKVEGRESDAARIHVQENVTSSINSDHVQCLENAKEAAGQDMPILGDTSPVISQSIDNHGQGLLESKAIMSPAKESSPKTSDKEAAGQDMPIHGEVSGMKDNHVQGLLEPKTVMSPVKVVRSMAFDKEAAGHVMPIPGDNSPVVSLRKDNHVLVLLEPDAVTSPIKELSPMPSHKEAAGKDMLILGHSSPVISQFNGKNNNVGDLLEPNYVTSPIKELRTMASDKEVVGQDILNLGYNSPATSQFNGKDNRVGGFLEPKAVTLPVKGMWQAVNDRNYSSPSNSSLRKLEQPIDECRAPIIDLDRNVEQHNNGSLFSLYAGQSRGDLLQSFANGPEYLSSSYDNEPMNSLKQTDLQFLMSNRGLSETMQFPHQFQEQQNLIEQAHSREKGNLYMRQIMNKCLFTNGSYTSQEPYASANSDLVQGNWFPDNHRVHNNYWSGVEPSSNGVQCLEEGGNSDGSLFSVLSSCRNRPSQSQYNTVDSEEKMDSRNFGLNNNGAYGYAPHQFRSSSIQEVAASSTTALHVPWINYQSNQNSNVQDFTGKPLFRSWNQ